MGGQPRPGLDIGRRGGTEGRQIAQHQVVNRGVGHQRRADPLVGKRHDWLAAATEEAARGDLDQGHVEADDVAQRPGLAIRPTLRQAATQFRDRHG
jgi:hypothetical protein